MGYLINKVDCLHRLEVDILRRRARATVASTPSIPCTDRVLYFMARARRTLRILVW